MTRTFARSSTKRIGVSRDETDGDADFDKLFSLLAITAAKLDLPWNVKRQAGWDGGQSTR